MKNTHIDISPSQQSCLNDMIGVIETLAQNGHFEEACITLKGDTQWWTIIIAMQGALLQTFSPSSFVPSDEPLWKLKVNITVPTPVPLSVLLHLASASSADVVMPHFVVRDGWCRTPHSTASLEVSMTVRKFDEFGGFATPRARNKKARVQ